MRKYRKIFIFVTHDPRIALFSDYRIVMKNGGMDKVFFKSEQENILAEKVRKLDDCLVNIRNLLRDGMSVSISDCIGIID